MICPECESEYVDGIVTCADCEVPLVPLDELGTTGDHQGSEALLPLARVTEPLLLAEITDELEKAQIPYVVYAGTGIPLLDDANIALAQPLSWEGRVWVVPNHAQQAHLLLARARKRYRDVPPRNTEINCY